MDKQALDRYLTTEPDNGYDNWLEKLWDEIPKTEISDDEYQKYERYFDDVADKLSKCGEGGELPDYKFCAKIITLRFKDLKTNISNIKNNLVLEPEMVKLLQMLNNNGHTTLVIGGSVRDAYLGIKPKDIDIEVYGMSYADLEQFLSAYGRVDIVGKTFGVIVFTHFKSKMRYDFSIPRTENKLGIGHTGFDIKLDSNLTVKEAAERRDFTFNALAYDPITNELHDYYGGIGDLENRIIRHTSDKFEDDFLRILRAMQFQCRFGFDIHYTTIYKIQKMLSFKDSHIEMNEFNLLSKERVFEEFMKWAEKGVRHDLIFKFMRDTHLIDYYPDLKALKSTPQDEIYHPEGSVERHTELCLNQIDRIVHENNITGKEKVILVMSVLLHDIAKPHCTEEQMKRGRMTITSNGHEEMGGVVGKEFLKGIGFSEELTEQICKLIANHLAGVNISMITALSGQVKAVKKLSRRLHPATIKQLLYVMDADTNGRGGTEHKTPTGANDIRTIADGLSLTVKQYEYILMGRHLIEANLKPSNEFGVILKHSYEAQENGEFNDVEGAKRWLANYLTPPVGVKKPMNNSFKLYVGDFIVYSIVMAAIAIVSQLLYNGWMILFNNSDSGFIFTFGVMMIISFPVLDYLKKVRKEKRK